MRAIKVSTLRLFWQRRGRTDAEQPLRAWLSVANAARWAGPADVKEQFRNASFVGDRRVVFNIAGNKYRLIVAFAYKVGVAYIKFIGTHAEYYRSDAATVEAD